ncbi:uncharacterized protein N7483_008194 [Penicillium malachiteum]|uniref:uncharacterized protein n=1 Tax=Penicillium malachiteum TaxID=1324776 RepID=UPI0025478C6C|nr:uncharacterized protein N7483_008194 [Penicillium malachiteum]KAJ5720260.1 hypothetical protein N7483_008194 [Penicillium malachiteum]
MLEQDSSDFKIHPLTQFLQSFTGLRHLKLKLSSFTLEPHLATAIAHHRSSLQSLIYHERELQLIDDEGRFQELRDKEMTFMVQLPHIVNLSQFSALALCASPSKLRSILEPLRKEASLHTLHLRWTGSEKLHRNIREELMSRLTSPPFRSPGLQLRPNEVKLGGNESHQMARTIVVSKSSPEEDEYLAFVQWAFGPQGMPFLETLALGDFSFGDRYRNQQLLLRRKTKEAQEIQYQEIQLPCGLLDRDFFVGILDDVSFHEKLMVEDLNFLRACPDGGLMDSPYE